MMVVEFKNKKADDLLIDKGIFAIDVGDEETCYVYHSTDDGGNEYTCEPEQIAMVLLEFLWKDNGDIFWVDVFDGANTFTDQVIEYFRKRVVNDE